MDEVGKLKAVRNEDCREEELRLMGLGDEVREARATGRSRLSVGGCGDGISSSGRAGPECKMETGADSEGEVPTEAECMAEELRGMGLHAEVDPDTGLMDIARPFTILFVTGHRGHRRSVYPLGSLKINVLIPL